MAYQADEIWIEAVDRGVALASFRAESRPDSVAIYALSERSSQAAVRAALGAVEADVLPGPASSRVRYLRRPEGPVRAVASIEFELVDDFVDALGRDGRITAQVNVVVVDDGDGDVACGSFDWVVLRRT